MDGDSHNDIKRGYLKCWSSMAEADIVFPNPSDLARVAVVSEIKGIDNDWSIRYSRDMEYTNNHTTDWAIGDKDMETILSALEYYAENMVPFRHVPGMHDYIEYVEGLCQSMENAWHPKDMSEIKD